MYNEMMKEQKHLEYLEYYHRFIDSTATTREEIEALIDRVDTQWLLQMYK